MTEQSKIPAFPSTFHNGWGEPEKGMLLRDYFAAQAMKYMSLPTMVYATGRIGDNTWELKSMDQFPFEDMSKVAYAWADAMLKARNQ
jgi:hypothetical protein